MSLIREKSEKFKVRKKSEKFKGSEKSEKFKVRKKSGYFENLFEWQPWLHSIYFLSKPCFRFSVFSIPHVSTLTHVPSFIHLPCSIFFTYFQLSSLFLLVFFFPILHHTPYFVNSTASDLRSSVSYVIDIRGVVLLKHIISYLVSVRYVRLL